MKLRAVARLNGALIALGAVVMLFASDASAAQIKRVLRGTASFDTDDTSQSIDLGTTVNTSKSLILIDWPAPTDSGLANELDQNTFFAAQFEDGGAVFIDRAGGTAAAAISWQVIEFEDGVSVQRGISSLANASACPTGCSKTIDITPLTDYKNAVPVVYTKGLFASNQNRNTMTDLFYVVPTITSNTALTLTRNRNTSNSRTVQITWQIIEFLNDAVVQTGTLNLPINQANDTAITTPVNSASSISLAGTGQNAMLFFNIAPGTAEGGQDSRFLVRGRVKDDDELEFVRRYAPNTANTAVDVRYYVVDFKEFPTLSISSSTNANPAAVNTVTAHGFKTGDVVKIINHATNTAINGATRTITVVDTDTFTVDGVAGNGVGGATGHVMLANDQLGFGDADNSVTTSHAATAVIDSGSNTYSDISSTVDNSTPVRVNVAGAHGWADQSRIRISGYTSIPALNGAWTIRTGANCNPAGGACTTTQFELVTSVDPGGVAGGAVANCVGLEELTYFAVTSSTDATPIVVTKNSHGFKSGELVQIFGHGTNTTANGMWIVQNPTTNTFELKNATGSGLGAGSGGSVIGSVTTTVSAVTAARTPVNLSGAGLASTAANTGDLPNLVLAQTLVDSTSLNTLRYYNSRNLGAVTFGYQQYEYPPLTMTAPNTGSEVWVVDAVMDVNWKSSLDVATHDWKLQYSTDGGSNWVDFGSVCGVAGTSACTGTDLSLNTVKVKVPDQIGTNVKMRVYNTTDTLADVTVADQRRQSDASNKAFKIRGSITNVVTNPDAVSPAKWDFGQASRDIRWNQTGSIGNIRIDVDYNEDGVFNASDNDFGGDTAMDGFPRVASAAPTSVGGGVYKYDWNNAWDVAGTALKAKVSAVTDGSGTGLVTATSSAFEIRPSITVTAPVSADEWNRGLTKNITWTATGNPGNVDIWLSYNTGGSYTKMIADNVAGGAGTYAWNIDANETLSDNCKVAVVKDGQLPSNYTIGDVSPDTTDVFKIIASLTLTAPTANQNPPWRVSEDKNVTWTVGGGSGVTTVDVYYTTNCTDGAVPNKCSGGATTWTLQANDVAAGGGLYPWTNLPTTLKGTLTGIKIVGNNNNNIFDAAGPFATKAKIALNAPGPIWRVGSNQTITWSSFGNPNNLRVYWGNSGAGGPWPNMITDDAGAGATSAPWNNIPASAISANLSIKVYDNADADVTTGVAAASAAFAVKPNITNVLLKKAGNIETVFLIGDTLRTEWTVAPSNLADTVEVRLDTNSGTGANGIGGDGDDFPTVIATAAASQGYADWTIPNNSSYALSTDRIRVVSQSDAAVKADSGNGAADFQIKGSLQITDPTGPWKLGTTQNINFTKQGVGNVNIIYALDGATFNDPSTQTKTVVSNYAGAPPYPWDIPNDALDIPASSIFNDVKTTIKFRVINAADTSVFATATNVITMRKQFASIAFPAVVYVDDNSALLSNITWSTKGNTDVTHPVKLYYDTASGAGGYPNPIPAAGTPLTDSGGYVWQVPDSIGGGRRIRVVSSTDPGSVFDDMTSDFTIRGKIDQLVPTAAGLVYNYNSPISVSWYNHGTLGAMTVKLATDGSNFNTTLKSLASTTANGPNTWLWTTGETGFPPAVGSSYKIKVEQDADASNVNVASANNFKVRGVLTLTALTGADSNAKWANVSDVKAITWNKSPSNFGDGAMELYYSTTGATACADGSWVNIDPSPGSFPNGTGASWNWTVPAGAISAGLTLKLQTSAGCSDTFAVSAATSASVKGAIFNLAVTESPTLEIRPAPAYSISWSSNPAAQGNVNINLYNGAILQRTIATVASETSPYAYTIPNNELANDFDNDMKIKVELVSDASNVFAEVTGLTIKKKYANVSVPAGVLRVDDNTALLSGISWNTYGNKAPAANYPVILSYDTGGNTFAGQINGGNSMPDTEAYTWQVPDSIGTGRKIRVKSSTFPNDVYGDSPAFEIKGRIDTLTPSAAGLIYDYNAPISISWHNHGTLGEVVVKLAADGTNFTTTLKTINAGSTPAIVNNGMNTYTWTTGETAFPPAVGTTYKVRVEQSSDASNVNVVSANNFRVKGVLNLTTANADGLWGNVGDAVPITWTKSPSNFADNSLSLYYSTDAAATTCGHASWVLITPDPNTTTGSPASYPWTVVEAAISSNFRLKIQEAGVACATASFDISDAASATIKGRITAVTAAGSPWLIGETKNVSWTSNPSAQGNVLVELSIGGGAYGPITGNAGTSTVNSNSSPFPWTIQEDVLSNDFTNNALIRVKLISDPNNVVDVIDAPITIKKRYTNVAVPAGTLVVGESNNITWNTYGNIGAPNQVLLAFDTNGGANGYTGQINSGNPLTDTESFAWTVPDSIGANRIIRVQSNAFPSDVSGVSGTFNIKGKVTPDINQGTVTLVVGQPTTINFAKSGSIGNLKIEYIHNGNSTVISPGAVPGPEGASGAASYVWSSVIATDSGAQSVIDVGGSKNSTLKFTGLTHLGGALEATATSAAFQVRGNLENLNFDGSGTGGQVLYIASSHFIEWKPSGNLGNVRIRMDRFGGLGPDLAASTGDEFTDVLTGPDATYPNAESIPYNYQMVGGVSKWEWTLPDSSSNAALIRIESLDNPANHADAAMRTFLATPSGTPFRIRGTYSNVTPQSAVKWKINSVNNLDWTASAAGMGNVNITLRYDSDANGTIDQTFTIANNTGVKPYSWTISNTSLVTEKAVVRIQQTSDGTGTVYAESQEFKIKPLLQLLVPNSNADQWVVGSQYDITWNAPQGAAPSFKVNISTDGGTTWNDGAVTSANKGGEITASAASAALEYADWTVPDIMTNQGVIRIRKVGDSDIEATDSSDAFFYVKGSITNVHIKNNAGDADPSVPLDLPIATTKYITWNYTGSLGTVDLSYSTDANAGTPTYVAIPGGTGVSVGSGGAGSFAWTIPNAPSANVRVKVTSSTNANWQTVNGLSFASAGPTYNSIIGSITAVSVVSDVNGTDAVVGANPKTIQWTPNGAIPLFDIYYNVNGGAWQQIANDVAGTVAGSDRTWTWPNIPDAISSDVEYRVEDAGNPTKTYFNTTANYRIKGSIDLTSPNGSNTLTVGTPFDIIWSKTGSIGNIDIQMSTDNFGSDVRTIVSSYASANSPYSWTPSATVAPVINYADMNADIIKVRLVSSGGIPVSDQSANGFKVVGQITNVQPSGGANIWLKGESRNITWSQIGNMGSVDIYYRTSGGATPYDIPIVTNNTGHTNGANSYTWNPVHDVNTEDAWIRVVDNGNASVGANSAAAFSIRPTITVTSPVAADRLIVGDTTQANIIKWTVNGTTGNVKVLYDSGAGYLDPANVIADNVPPGNGVAGIAWNPIPNAISSAVKIKVVDKSNLNVFDESDAFKIKGSITISGPTGGTHLTAGSNQNVTWSMTGTLPVLDVEYNLNGGVGGWTAIGAQAGVGNTSHPWNPIPTTTTNSAQVRLRADYADNDLDITTTGTNFFIENVFSNLLPTNGAVVKVGDVLPNITWNVGAGTGITAVKIEYTNNQSAGGAGPTWTTVTDTAPNTGSFSWTWPGALADLNNDARLRITQWNPQNASTTFVATGSPFSVQPVLTLTAPGLGSESWGVNTTQAVKFTKRGAIQTVNLYYAADGATYDPTPINPAPINVSALADDTEYTYNWLIDPNTTSLTNGFTGKIKVKVNTPGTQVAVEDVQSNAIEVKGTLALNTPDAAGITLYVGETYNITWTKFGAITNVDLHYSVNGGAYQSIVDGSNVPATDLPSTPSTYQWLIPDNISGTVRVRVRDNNNNGVLAASTNSFRILGKIVLSNPDLPGIVWTVGQNNKTINWTSTGTFPSVDVHFARYGNFGDAPNVVNIGTFANCTPVAPAITCNGQADWAQVLDRITATARVRVRDTGFPADVADTSANDFKVIGSFTSISSPAAGNVWNVGDTSKQIQWNSNGTITNVKLEYKTSAGGSWVAPAIADSDAGHTSGGNTFNWTAGIPDVNTEDAYVRISDANFAEVTPIVSAAFRIRPVITVSEPTAAQELIVGTNYPNLIKWSRTGTTITQVKILYSTDGTNFPDPANVIADNVPVANGVAGVTWNIPDSVALSSTAKIRVMDKGNNAVVGDSAPFILKGGLTLTAPTGSGTTWIAGSTTNSVTWTYKGAFPVEVRYDSNSGLGADGIGGNADDYPVLIGTKVAPGTNSGANSINWDLSAATGTNTTTVSNKGRVKIFDPANPTTVVSGSLADFNIGGQFDVTAPEAGTDVFAENSFNITWTPVAGTGISDVKIEYSNNSEDSTPTWVEIAPGTVKPNTGSYSWNPVPGALADLNNTNRVRVSQKNPLNAATINVGGGAPFKIKPTLEVTAPGGAGNTTLKVGTPYPIKLKKKGAVQTVDFFYSHDGAPGNYVKINGAAVDISGAADGNGEYTFNWTPLESHTLTAGFAGKIKAVVVTPSTQNTIEDVQSNSTELTGDLVLNTPTAAGIILEVTDSYPITWTKYSVASVKIYYSTDGGIAGGGSYPADPPNITTVASTPSSFNWPVPDQIGANLRVRIVDASNPLVVKESASTFAIRGKLIMDTVLPASLRVDANQVIQWTPKGTMATVKLEYSTDDFTLPGNIFPVTGPSGESAATLAAGAHNVQQSFTWKVPNNISNTVKVRVVNNADAAVKGTSNQSKIIGEFVLTAPLGGGGQFLKVNDPYTITWERHGAISQAKLEYSTNGFVNETQTTVIATVNATDLSYPWTVPNSIGNNVKVRVSDPAYNGTTVHTLQDVSDTLEIRGQIKFNPARVAPGPDSPLGGEVWLIGTDHTLQWEKHGTIPSVKVEYKVGAGAWDYVADSGANDATSVAGDTFSWRVPDQKGLNNVIVRVTNLGDGNVYMDSNNFTIRAGFTWTNPAAAAQVFNQGQTYILTWDTNGTVASVDLKYSTNNDPVYDGDGDPNYVFMKNNLNQDADGINNTGSFNWPVPTNIAASKDVYFAIVDNTDPDAKNVSPKVKIAGVLTMDEPDNTPIVERWGVTTNQDIRWTMVGNVANVKIEYTKDITAGTPVWENPAIANSVVASNLSYTWTNIPTAAVSAKAAVRVSDAIADSGTAPAISPLFKIVGTFSPSAPIQDAVWKTTGTQGSLSNPTRNIVWTTQGAIPQANLYYSTTGNTPGAWTLINGTPINDAGAGGNYAWTVPQVFSSNMVIRIQDNDDALTYYDTGVFTVRGDVKITSPVGGELWGVAEVQNITWDGVGTVGSPNEVYLFYKKSAGGAWIAIEKLTGGYNIPNSGSFAWTPAESDLSTDAYVKIENSVAPTDSRYVSTQSPAAFKLMRRYQLVDPDGGEVYTAGTAKDILWNRWGTPNGDVRIDLALDGVNFTTNIAVSTPNDGVYSWTPLASQVAPAAKIRIRDINDVANEKAYISQTPFVIRATLILDAMPATVNIGDVYDILWTRQGDIANAKIVYTTTGNFALDSRPIEDLNGNPMAGGLVPNQDTVSGNPLRGRHRWKVPDLILSERANLRVRIVDPNDDPGSENISANFRIIPKFTVTAPNGNANAALTDKLKVGQPYTITWTSTSSSAADKTPNVTILYSVNGGGSFPNTITTTPNDGSYDWVVPATGGVPDDISDQVKVKVVSANAAEATALAEDASDNNIKIITNFTLTAPNGGATYEVGDPFTITWTKIGSSANVQLSYSTNGSDFSAPTIIESPTPNDLTQAWLGNIPDAIGTNLRVRVKSTTDDGEDISDSNFRIRGKLTVTAPANGTPVPIGQNYLIQWTTNGTVPNVKIVYDINDGKGADNIAGNADDYPYTIVNSVANANQYNWTNIPDTGTANARIRVIDTRAAESDVIGTSAKFNIVGNFTMLTPANGSSWVVGTSQNVTWNWGGTIQRVALSYTTNPALAETAAWTAITTIDYGPASGDGANGTAVRTYAWTIPDTIAPSVRFKVQNADDSSVYDVSTGSFTIRGGFTLAAPALNNRWVTNEVRNISWTTSGTIPNVKIEYSHDNFATAGIVINASYANNGNNVVTNYAWTVPDPGIANVPKSTKVRVSDVNDANSFVLSDAFNIDYYNITWEIRDLVTNASLSQLTVNEVKASDPNFIQWSEAGISTNPPRVQKTPYGTWVATWSKSGFGDGVQVVVANADQSILLFMETSTVHIWLADSEVSYTPATLTTQDKLEVVAWLSRDGSITTGAIGAVYKIYDGSTLLYTLNDNTVDAAGFMNFTVNGPTGFTIGKTYTAICEVTVGSGGVFKTPSSFEITTPKTLQDVKNVIDENIDKPLSQIDADLQTTLNVQTGTLTGILNAQTVTIQNELDAQTTTINTKLDSQTALIQAALTSFENTIETAIVDLNEAAESSLESAEVLEATALKFSWKAVVAPNPVLQGDEITMNVQGPARLFPTLTVYNHLNEAIIERVDLMEDIERPGNYTYSWLANSVDFTAGEAYTYLVTESTTGGLVAGSGFIESISLTSVAGLAAAAPAAEKAAKAAVDAIEKLEASMAKGGDLKDTMKLLKSAVEDFKYQQLNIPERENRLMRERVAEIVDRLKKLGGTQGLEFDELLQKAIDESSTIQDIRTKTGAAQQAVDLIGAVVEKRLGGVEEPIVDIQLEPAS